jgi:hypothetical protein
MRGISFNGEFLYIRTAGSGFSGVLTGVGGGASLGKNRAGRLLILLGRQGWTEDCFPILLQVCLYTVHEEGDTVHGEKRSRFHLKREVHKMEEDL